MSVTRYVTTYSIYEVNTADRLVRRVHGKLNPTEHVGQDGVWQSYESLLVTDDGLLIVWGTTPDGTVLRRTWTSPVVTVEQVP